ncbi:hypothetical protein [Luteibacter sp. 329MFSha]|uniref:hypothetical protein n=1 Tax=Luteibacter sp. 329MFSha TaxID=1798239 RepID=UPI00111410FB|nr:hypothetical protein [Luteibacter sp. 329MFSha]
MTFAYKVLRTTGTLYSEKATFTIGAANEPFEIDSSPVDLSGSATYTREATGGTPPYAYTSSAPGIVTVPDPAKGDIRALADGDAVITARDSRDGIGSYPVTVTGNAIVLRPPKPDFLVSGSIDVGLITDSRGLRVVVETYEGMAAGQRIELRCMAPEGVHTPAVQTVTTVVDHEFYIPKSFIETIVANFDPAIAAFDYSVTPVSGIPVRSTQVNVIFREA